jgi:hypothetical protein
MSNGIVNSYLIQEGLLKPFKVNRPLTEQEIADRLPLRKASGALPKNQFSTIRINSTFLEIRDKFFVERGMFTALALFAWSVFSVGVIFPPIVLMDQWPTLSDAKKQEAFWACLALVVMFFSAIIFIWFWRVRKECYRYTHYPIRFNRKTRMVHVFRLDGTVMSESWDKLCFTLCRHSFMDGSEWEVRAHRLSEDGATVLETFGLTGTVSHKEKDEPLLRGVWELVRRYMEDGPQEVLPVIDHANDIVDRRETYMAGVRVLMEAVGNFFLLLPLGMFFGIGRWLCMRSCKIPQWPQEIEDVCQIEADDPYLIDAQHMPEPPDEPEKPEPGYH